MTEEQKQKCSDENQLKISLCHWEMSQSNPAIQIQSHKPEERTANLASPEQNSLDSSESYLETAV